jgi:2-polyprenyl-3-methyl-5-hydroxy-6-metoxy-1,4-benzoquinol methylase
VASTACVLCGEREGTLVAVNDRHGNPLPVTCCKGCGLTYVDPIPTQPELAQFYAERYRLEYKQASQPRLKHIYRAGRVALDRLRIAALLAAPPARVLDCGAGGGEFSYLMTSRGYRLTGIEPNDGYREFARREYGVDLRPGTLDDVSFDAGEFDLVTIFHVLEHVRDPGQALTRLAGWLKPGGHLYIEVPNALTEVSSPSNLYHRAHLYYFAPQPLVALAQRAGLRAVLADGAPSRANLTAVFRKELNATAGTRPASAHDAVVAANRQRTLGRYLTASATLGNVLPRLVGRMAENRVEKAGLGGRATLDQLNAREAPQLAGT